MDAIMDIGMMGRFPGVGTRGVVLGGVMFRRGVSS